MNTTWYAHSLEGRPEDEWEPLCHHLRDTRALAEQMTYDSVIGQWAAVAACLHDMGKATKGFQRRIRSQGPKVDHSTQGAIIAIEEAPHRVLGELLAYVIAGHHGGLPNGGMTKEGDLQLRLRKELETPDPNFSCDACAKLPWVTSLPCTQNENSSFNVALSLRMVASLLCDADSLATEAFQNKQQSKHRGGLPGLEVLATGYGVHMRKLLASAGPTKLNILRHHILDHARSQALLTPGFFSLNVPTGGGKTLTSLGFALDHARAHGLRRIIYAIPYTSIIDQTAAVFKEFLPAEGVLEHHATVTLDDGNLRQSLAMENWDAPLVVTTNVQFFESLFANKRSRLRKLHNIAGSVIILDEAQMLPPRLLIPCIAVLQELVATHGCSVVLCTATQPALDRTEHRPWGIPAMDIRPLAPGKHTGILPLHEQLRRVNIQYVGELDKVELCQQLQSHDQVLTIVAIKSHARECATMLQQLCAEAVLHLSTNMCPMHRKAVLDDIRHRLATGQPCRVVSTSLVEAGVDVDFPVVFRTLAGVDSIAQAAGRCNREGGLTTGNVYVFIPADTKIPAGDMRQAADATKQILRTSPDADLLAPDVVHRYFTILYGGASDSDNLDSERIMADSNAARQALSNGKDFPVFPFADIARKFRFIKSDEVSVFIPWDEDARAIAARLISGEVSRKLYRSAQPYMVGVYDNALAQLHSMDALKPVTDDLFILRDMRHYDERVGLSPRNVDNLSAELVC